MGDPPNAPALPFEILEHPADVGFLARGATLPELFAHAALAIASIACDLKDVRETAEREIRVTGETIESLLYAWLAEILAIADAERFVFRRFKVQELNDTSVRGTGYGEPYDRSCHAAHIAIKAVTYHQFAVVRTAEGFEARVYLDL